MQRRQMCVIMKTCVTTSHVRHSERGSVIYDCLVKIELNFHCQTLVEQSLHFCTFASPLCYGRHCVQVGVGLVITMIHEEINLIT